MISELGGATASLVKLALDAAVLRHQVIANNIANAKTPDFRPQYVSFEDQLGFAVRDLSATGDDRHIKMELGIVRRNMESGQLVQTAEQNRVQIDQEMARLSANVVHYQALLEGLNKRGDLIKMAISGQGGR